jgi:hypothetical protein
MPTFEWIGKDKVINNGLRLKANFVIIFINRRTLQKLF